MWLKENMQLYHMALLETQEPLNSSGPSNSNTFPNLLTLISYLMSLQLSTLFFLHQSELMTLIPFHRENGSNQRRPSTYCWHHIHQPTGIYTHVPSCMNNCSCSNLRHTSSCELGPRTAHLYKEITQSVLVYQF